MVPVTGLAPSAPAHPSGCAPGFHMTCLPACRSPELSGPHHPFSCLCQHRQPVLVVSASVYPSLGCCVAFVADRKTLDLTTSCGETSESRYYRETRGTRRVRVREPRWDVCAVYFLKWNLRRKGSPELPPPRRCGGRPDQELNQAEHVSPSPTIDRLILPALPLAAFPWPSSGYSYR